MAFLNPITPIPTVPFSTDLSQALTASPAGPLALLPVRVETRFFPGAPGTMDLCVRIYPDKIHTDTHEPELTADEITWGQHYWEQTWKAGKNQDALKSAWRQLADRFDARRAAWIVRALKPLNAEDRPAAQIPDDAPLPTPIKFPPVKSRAKAWTRAPQTEVLPERWWVFGYQAGNLVLRALGNPIPKTLPTGPDPNANTQATQNGDLAIDAGMKWMVDFAEAEKVGMGLRIRLTGSQTAGFDFLLVFGVKSAADAANGAAQMAKLFDAHHYADGLSFLLQGTPSNNTADALSGFDSIDDGQEQSYAAERTQKQFAAGDGSSADVLSTALGLRPQSATALSNIGNAAAHESTDAFHMNRALWAGTWGYFLAQLIGSPLTADDRAWARRHFNNYVRAGGLITPLRIGKQPYGILPATSLDIWKPKTGDEQTFARDTALKNLLISMRKVWRAAVTDAPRAGKTANPDQDFSDIFSLDGISSNYQIRHLMGDTYLRALWTAMAPGDQTLWWQKQQELARVALTTLGLNINPRLSRVTYSGWSLDLKGPAVQSPMLAEDAPLNPDYIGLLLNETDLDKLHNETFAQFQPRGLLYSLLRNSLLQEYWNAAAEILGSQPAFTTAAGLNFESEVISGPGSRVWDLLTRPMAGNAGRTIWQFLSTLTSPPADKTLAVQVASLVETKTSLAWLRTLSARKLERLFAGTLDLCAYRLDAWTTSFATKRLSLYRQSTPQGITIGGYGWVTNVRPAAAPVPAAAPKGQTGSFLKPANNPGYTLTPSLAQASTVGVLRSGHLTHADQNTKDLLAIDLASDRVRLAKWLFDGVRQGQPLGALLGYRFERRLQLQLLGQFIPAFRQLAPLVANKLSQTADAPPGTAVEALAANNVADGLVLQRRWAAAKTVQTLFASLTTKPAVSPQQVQSLSFELNSLTDAVDAASDALLAESVHHAVQGNPLTTASTLDSIAGGDVPPPELDVIKTPRTGTALTFRVATLWNHGLAVAEGWTTQNSPRANAEPNLNAWVSRLLPSPDHVRCLVERLDPNTNAVLETKEVRVSELAMAPLDFIYASTGDKDATPAELELRILHRITKRTDGFDSNSVIRINLARGSGWDLSDLGYGEFRSHIEAIRKLITGTRGIDGAELNLPERNQVNGIDIRELQARADAAVKALREVHDALQSAKSSSTPDTSALGVQLLACTDFGIAGSVPYAHGESAADALERSLSQATSVAAEIADRLSKIDDLGKNFDSATASDKDQFDFHVSRLKTVFGTAFVLLPVLSVANSDELKNAIADTARIQDNDPLAAVTWLTRISRVREGVARFTDVLRNAEVLGTSERLDLRIAQLPFQQHDRWIGLPIPQGKAISSSRFSLVLQSHEDLDIENQVTGLLIDELIEVMPNDSETAGMVFQYDQPNAAPPQCVVLAVPPDPDQPWNLWSLQHTLLETLDLARIRAVDPSVLNGLGHYLPAIYLAVNTAGDTISTDFSKLKQA